MVSQLISDGTLVSTTTAGAGPCIGIATHDGISGERIVVESDRIFRRTNGTSGDAFSEASFIGAPAYALDNQTVADNDNGGTLQQCGTFQGMDADGKVRIRITADLNRGTGLQIQVGTATFAAGVKAISAGITVTATSRVFATRVNEAGTDGDEIRVPTADRTVGGPGTGALTFRSFLSGGAATSDTSTFEYMIVG